MKIKLFIFLLLLASCKTPKETKTMIQKMPVEIEITEVENNFTFTVLNNSAEPIKIINPRKITVQKLQNDNWQNLRILICPCDAPCNAPKESISVDSNQVYSFNWNKKESWCGNRTPYGIRETIEQLVDPGKFKILVSVEKSDQSIEIISKEFEIK
ncbi:MAG: hypothetical protein RBT49_03960 [Bacteroidales bacterium]|jgi:hypothetical protein|nr:hypothetical protein [Bacteroidales bacterium]